MRPHREAPTKQTRVYTRPNLTTAVDADTARLCVHRRFAQWSPRCHGLSGVSRQSQRPDSEHRQVSRRSSGPAAAGAGGRTTRTEWQAKGVPPAVIGALPFPPRVRPPRPMGRTRLGYAMRPGGIEPPTHRFEVAVSRLCAFRRGWRIGFSSRSIKANAGCTSGPLGLVRVHFRVHRGRTHAGYQCADGFSPKRLGPESNRRTGGRRASRSPPRRSSWRRCSGRHRPRSCSACSRSRTSCPCRDGSSRSGWSASSRGCHRSSA